MDKKIKKIPASELLIRDGWFETKAEMLPWIMSRQVLVNEVPVLNASDKVPENGNVRVREYYKRKYVGKGGLKLEHAIKTMGVEVNGRVAFDCGASTGGFTDCLLNFGAVRVYAADAGFDQLASKLCLDERVVNLERTNISDSVLKELDPKPTLASLDLSYLSLKVGLEAVLDILARDGEVVALIKPIFEIESGDIRRSGEINDAELQREAINNVLGYADRLGFSVLGITYSPIRGNNGAVEYFVHLSCRQNDERAVDITDEQINETIRMGLDLPSFKK